ncbi:hypothetical protein K438DRAFT_1777413 [Mycena galopus ATCC 62051]|nr:hypothetical protein K438DRAFT_1777413 [Mycena galopus ATCC 62051]
MAVQLEIHDIKNSLYIAMVGSCTLLRRTRPNHSMQNAKAEVFLYGGYSVLFEFYIHLLHTRGLWRQAWKNRVLPVATILLFMLCTAHLVSLLACTALLDRAEVADPEDIDLVNQSPNTESISVRATNAIYVTRK